MSEQKPLPCAFCGKEPRGEWRWYDLSVATFWCGSNDCFMSNSIAQFIDGAERPILEDWNNLQRQIMNQRHKDYEAGWNQGYCKGNNFDYRTIDTNRDFESYITKEQSK